MTKVVDDLLVIGDDSNVQNVIENLNNDCLCVGLLMIYL